MLERIYLLLEIVTVVFCLCSLYGQKFQLDFYTAMLIGVDIICLEAVNEGILSENTGVLLYIAVFVYCLVKFKGTIKRALVNNIMYIVIVSVLQLMCSMLFIGLNTTAEANEIIVLVINILVLATLLLMNKIINLKKISDYVVTKEWIFGVLSVLYLILMIYSIQKYRNDNMLATDYYLLLMGFVILTAVFSMKWQENRNKIMQQKLELEMYEVYNQTFEELLQNIRRKQHDYKNQIVAIRSLQYTSKSYEELVARQNDYLEYLNRDNEFNHLLAVNMPIIGGFLYSKFSTWKNLGVDITYEIHSNVKSVAAPIYEVITILGILLDNAYDAVESCPAENKKIQFIMEDRDSSVLFSVKNPGKYVTYDEIGEMFKEGHSSKGNGRGIGLYNAKTKALKYDMGLLVANEEIEHQNWICFSLEIKRENERDAD